MNRRHVLFAVSIVTAGAILPACGSSNNTTSSGGGSTGPCAISNTSATDGGGASLKIGAKSFTEEKLLAELTKVELGKHNFTIDDSTHAADPAIGQAIASNQIQMLWQYTGTELGAQYLNVTPIPTDLDQAFNKVAQLDAAKSLCWTSETKFDDTNGIGIRSADTSKFGTTLSSFTAYLQQHTDVKICIASEFRTRSDGLPGLASTYGTVWANYPGLTDVSQGGESVLANKQCDAAEVFTTDAALQADNLVALQDDKKLFPADNAGLMVRADTLSAHPAIANLMAPIAAKLTTTVMVGLNKMVDVDGMSVTTVATNWLSQNGF
ncbi:MAG TPA: glycine betaine ABC transporter substrate-binding protein [Candidatus Dormibacteraeota bacterium]|jgi:osmoprotectant transport system substrate-binding protein|nr:glycine betaine ABC transporter substrate-binding protein [Candidatus Dormibacteraeota bacterium]